LPAIIEAAKWRLRITDLSPKRGTIMALPQNRPHAAPSPQEMRQGIKRLERQIALVEAFVPRLEAFDDTLLNASALHTSVDAALVRQQAVDEMIEMTSWSEHLPAYTGHRGSAAKRLNASRTAYRAGRTP
jgi:hypothetical protein